MQQDDVDDTTARKSDPGKARSPKTPAARLAEDVIQQQTPTPENTTQGLGEQMHSSNEATQRCPQSQASPITKYQYFERLERPTHMVFEGEPAVKLHAKNI